MGDKLSNMLEDRGVYCDTNMPLIMLYTKVIETYTHDGAFEVDQLDAQDKPVDPPVRVVTRYKAGDAKKLQDQRFFQQRLAIGHPSTDKSLEEVLDALVPAALAAQKEHQTPVTHPRLTNYEDDHWVLDWCMFVNLPEAPKAHFARQVQRAVKMVEMLEEKIQQQHQQADE
jgi:hypothetical protein